MAGGNTTESFHNLSVITDIPGNSLYKGNCSIERSFLKNNRKKIVIVIIISFFYSKKGRESTWSKLLWNNGKLYRSCNRCKSSLSLTLEIEHLFWQLPRLLMFKSINKIKCNHNYDLKQSGTFNCAFKAITKHYV